MTDFIEHTDEDFDALVDEQDLVDRRQSAEKKYEDLDSNSIEHLRRRMKYDTYFLASILGYKKLHPVFHGHYTQWLERQRGQQYRLTLFARGHYKSTLNTITDSIQMALPNVGDVLQAHPYAHGPNLKLLIAHEVREKASEFLFEIASAFTKNETMLALFPECIPSKRVQRINKWELELPREDQHRHATFSTIGAGGAAQSGHYHWLKLDDLVGEDAANSETVMNRINNWFDNIGSLLTDLEIDGWDLIGTRWAFSDIYSHAIKIYGIDTGSTLVESNGRKLRYRNSVTNCLSKKDLEDHSNGLLRVYARGAIEHGEPVFPIQYNEKKQYLSGFSHGKLNILRKNSFVWASQYANNPMEAGLTEFIWPLKYYKVDFNGNISVDTGDPNRPMRKVLLRDLAIYIFCDPSMGESNQADETGIVVTGVDKESNIYLLETIKKRLRPPEFVDNAFRLYMKYRPRVFAIEEVNFSGIYRYWIERESAKSRVNLPITPYKPGSKRSKEARIRGLAHFFSAGQVYVHENMHDFRDEYEQFPMGQSQHLLDSLAQGPEFWKSGMDTRSIEQTTQLVNNLLAERSILTGY